MCPTKTILHWVLITVLITLNINERFIASNNRLFCYDYCKKNYCWSLIGSRIAIVRTHKQKLKQFQKSHYLKYLCIQISLTFYPILTLNKKATTLPTGKRSDHVNFAFCNLRMSTWRFSSSSVSRGTE